MVDEAPGITRLVNKLERAGLLRRERSTPDRRQVICVISAKGLDVLAKIDPLIGIADKAGTAGLNAQEQRVMIRLLDKVRNSISASDL
jgi:DNA-binding MarR family transcriptional regulator